MLNGGDEILSKTRHSQRRLKLCLLLLCQMRDINSRSRGNALTQNKGNSLLCAIRTSRQRSRNKKVGYLQWLISIAFGLFITVWPYAVITLTRMK